jgi:hypothetical protein
MKTNAFWEIEATSSIFIDQKKDFIVCLIKAGFPAEDQGGEAATETRTISRKDAKAAKFGDYGQNHL